MSRGDDVRARGDDTGMRLNGSAVGTCPDCQAAIPNALVLIEYESARGRSLFAECPDCGEIVHPETGS